MISENAQIVPGAPTTFVYFAFPVRFFPAGVYCFVNEKCQSFGPRV